MLLPIRERRRRGAVLPLITVCLVGLMGFLALGIDLGMLMMARTQAQNAADGAALAGARNLNGVASQNNNVTAAVAQAQTIAEANAIMNTNITQAQVTATPGIYEYSTSAQRFQAVFGQTPGTNQSYGVMQVSITTSQPTFFANIFGVSSMTVAAVATAIHKPNDISIVLDFSGSMAFSSTPNYSTASSGTPITGSLNPDSNYPQFGPWSIFGGSMVMSYSSPGSQPSSYSTYSPPTPMQRVWPYVESSGYLIAPSNTTMTTDAGPPIVGNFLLSDQVTNAFVNSGSFPSFTNVNSGGSQPTTIATPAPSSFVSQNVSGYVGDMFPLQNGTTVSTGTAPTCQQYAQCVADVIGISRSNISNTVMNLNWETFGYDATYTNTGLTATAVASTSKFQGFSMGPGYYGKTFYMWPPDPRTPSGTMGGSGYVAGDWRQRFFTATGSNTTQDNSIFWNSSGVWQGSSGSSPKFIVNYSAVLAWLANGPQTLPQSLCSGRVVYYTSMPASIPVSSTTGVISSSATSDQCFWKDYIDYVLGCGRWAPATDNLYGVQSANSNTGNGSTLYYNSSASALTPQITSYSTLSSAPGAHTTIKGATNASPIVITTSTAHGLTSGQTVTITGVGGNTAANGKYMVNVKSTTTFQLLTTTGNTTGNGNYTSGGSWTTPVPSMNYNDSPIHPRAHFWFGPLTMLCYLKAPGNWYPGTCYEAQCWQVKVGISAALADIQNNHPNDLAALMYFDSSNGYSTARVGMSNSFTQMQNALFFPFTLLSNLSSSSATTLPYTASPSSATTGNPAGLTSIAEDLIPNAGSGTCAQMGFMVAYNQFGNATDSTVTPKTTYQGRQTAAKVVIYETDGLPDGTANGTLTGSGAAGNWYYGSISAGSASNPTTNITDTYKEGACTVVQHICASTSASPPGYSTTRNPAYVHAVAFGDLFESTSTSNLTTPALQFLAAVQCYGNTSQWPGGSVPAPGTMASWYTNSLSASTYYTTPQPFKVITGSYSTRISNIGTCIQTIMQSGVQIALIQ